jgi:spore germination protein
MTNFRQKLIDLKQRLQKGKMYSITILLLAIVGGLGLFQYQRSQSLRQELDTHYNRAFFDMLGYVQNVETLLLKSAITSTPQKTSSTLKEAWRQANLAQENLGLLPIQQNALSNTSKFLTQVSDLSFALSTQNEKGRPLSSDQYDTLEKLNGYAGNLKVNLLKLQDEIVSGRIQWGTLYKKGFFTMAKASAELPVKNFENIDKAFKEYPSLIYDGPFSDHLTSTKPRGLTGSKVNLETAEKKAREFIGPSKISNVEFLGKDENNHTQSYNFAVTLNEMPKDAMLYISITEKGAHPLWMLYHRESTQPTLTMEKAKKAAGDFLISRGFPNMKTSYYLKEDGFATINFAFTQNEVTMYPDLIKVRVALDNGEICGFESRGYLAAHHDRNIPTPAISMEEAKNAINPSLEIYDSGLAMIPTEFKTEVFVYEFKGKTKNQNFIVYVNAKTGEEEDVLILLETQEGTLTL